jgi:D,D-heptose 1,7-bisphosphate phosphatase
VTATVTQCAVLVGGRGTRLGTLTEAVPKPLLRCGDRPFLAWLLRELVRFGVSEFLLLTGHLSAEVERAAAAIQASLPRQVRITLSAEPARAGTGGALLHARDHLHEQFLLCNGDSLFDCNLALLLADAAAEAPGVIGRVMLRQQDDVSRFGVVTLDRDRITEFRPRPSAGHGGIINGGVYLFRKQLIDSLAPGCSLEADVLPGLAAAGQLRGIQADGYFRDIGTPDDLALAQTEIPARLHRRALFLDRDGVLNVDRGYVSTREDFEWVEDALEAVRHATSSGWHVFVVTNQSGVARGLYDEAAARGLLQWISDEAHRSGGTIDDWRYCPFHPEATVENYRRAHSWRKPSPGMLLDLMQAWEVDPCRSVMIGDQPTDMQAAASAGVAGHLFGGGNLLSFIQPIIDKHS